MVRAPRPRNSVDRGRWLELIDDNPLRFFAVALFIVEVMLVAIAFSLKDEFRIYAFIVAVIVVIVAIVATVLLALKRPTATIDFETLADRLCEDVWYSMDGALANLDSIAEQAEAWAILRRSSIELKRGEMDEPVGKFRKAFAEGIKDRIKNRQPKLLEELVRIETVAAAADRG